MTTIQSEHFTKALTLLLDETFSSVQGIYLDKGTSLFETLATVSAAEASIPVGGKCASLAAQVKHIIFYLDVVEKAARTGVFEENDWGEVWRTTEKVSAEEWQKIQTNLQAAYERIKQFIDEQTEWESEDKMAMAMAFAVHTAYHLGEIRQALCTLK